MEDFFENEQAKQKDYEHRRMEQEQNKDYSYWETGEIEKCDECGCEINSHGHCPRCDY